MDAKVGKLLVIGASLGCLSPALTIAACLSYKSPFSAPFEQQDAAMRAKQGFAATGMQSLHIGIQYPNCYPITDNLTAAEPSSSNRQ